MHYQKGVIIFHVYKYADPSDLQTDFDTVGRWRFNVCTGKVFKVFEIKTLLYTMFNGVVVAKKLKLGVFDRKLSE